MTRTRRPVDFTELFACAARYAGATVRWRESMRLEVTDAEVAEAARELSMAPPRGAHGARS